MPTTENRDPVTCRHCGTVNAWNAVNCRGCGQEISRQMAPADGGGEISVLPVSGTDRPSAHAPGAESSLLRSDDDAENGQAFAGESPHKERRRWNVFWIVLGIALHVVVIHIGVFAIIKAIEQDQALKTVVEKILNASQLSDNGEEKKILESVSAPVKSKLNKVRGLLLLLLVLTPVLIGAVIGYFSGSILEGAAAMGLSAVLIPLLNNTAFFAVLWGPANAVLGGLGALLGCRLRQRIQAK